MSFLFNWMDLKILDLKTSINSLLSSIQTNETNDQSNESNEIPKNLSISSLSIGKTPPIFELLEIIDLKKDKFKGLFKFLYNGELNITFKTDYEANSIKLIQFDDFTKPNFILVDKSSILPVEFKIKNLKIDSFLTVVYNLDKITIVFNDDPFIDLDFETSLDEFLDDELFKILKNDVLNLITEGLKHDLPELLRSYIPNEDLDNAKIDTIIENNQHIGDHEIEDKEEVLNTTSCFKLQEHGFDTLSLAPQGFKDVIQRIALSHIEYQNMEVNQSHDNDLSFKKRRRIKMKSKKHTKHQISQSSTLTPEIHIDQTNQSSSLLESESEFSTTLIDSSFTSTNSLNDYLTEETLKSNSPILEKLDPYESLTHPMDLLPNYSNLKDIDTYALSIDKFYKSDKKGRPSSNYINLNNDYKEFMNNNQQNQQDEDDDDEVFYDFD
ncbi:hypothetical protein BN7_3093 [Wickerhamomyces ciferrii]|uniref:SMP-LTD domain-containing protein n=1 Tax=Wickerhamomyces ciferrii (strain ATCC 14091 / BCRC 22168 / CBS 111 / JCM 3599 / NBRC 0793 / NRRL Y-1031 F-60-10) TaxID=1206466 RepID=K0KKM3_WICCF|nr:uncharacterized protein BN7_3093 [Wickerhamomyces ciferrii]CCH43541.1 hypothetical protein BN7_3093 [Wickerhamomyces ciferrii]